MLRLVPNVVDIDGDRRRSRRSRAANAMLMVADYTYEPNANGLRFLLDEVMPRVWATRPDTVLRLVGRGLEDPAPGEPRVQAAGFVDDLDAEYAAACCAVVPLLEGGGTPFKFLEALAHGRAGRGDAARRRGSGRPRRRALPRGRRRRVLRRRASSR